MLVIFEMANNAGGSNAVALKMLAEFSDVAKKYPQFEYAFKTQYRDLDSYIHPSADPDHKYVQRFRKTDMTWWNKQYIAKSIKELGFKAICTPFDEPSVTMAIGHGYDILKVGSPSITDWPLWTKIRSDWGGPVIASVGGATQEDIDRVVKMYKGNLTLMHCVSEYPTETRNLNLGQIVWLKKRYPKVKVGFSSHEEFASEGIDIAAAFGAEVIERHICIDEKPNKYSLLPHEMEWELKVLYEAHRMVGTVHERVAGFKPTQLMRQMIDGRMQWKP